MRPGEEGLVHESPSDLPRRLTAFNATTIIVGSIIGSGVFLKQSAIASLLPDPVAALAVWCVAGILTLFGAFAFAELGGMFPQSGGLYRYIHEAYGPFLAFLFGWCMLTILESGSIAGIAAGVASLAAGMQKGLGWHVFTATEQIMLAGSLVTLLTLVNVWSVRAGAEVQNVFTIAKVIGVVLLIFGAFLLGHGTLANFTAGPPSATQVGLVSAFGLAIVKALWAYDGWVNVTYVSGEIQEPQKNLPRALLFGTVFVIVVYVLANASYHWVLPVAQVQAAKSPAAEVALAVLGPAGMVVMSILMMVSTFGTLNSSVLAGPRVYFAMARDRLFFPSVGQVHPRFLTPHIALLTQCACALALLGMWGHFERITDNVVFVYWIFYALGAGAVMVLRARRPDLERPYRTIGYPVVPLIFIAVSVWLTINTIVQSPKDAAQALALLAAGVVLYPFFKRYRADVVEET